MQSPANQRELFGCPVSSITSWIELWFGIELLERAPKEMDNPRSKNVPSSVKDFLAASLGSQPCSHRHSRVPMPEVPHAAGLLPAALAVIPAVGMVYRGIVHAAKIAADNIVQEYVAGIWVNC